MTDPESEADREAAHVWIVRMHGPDAEASRVAFETWLDEKPARRDIYRDLQAQWDRAKFLTHTRTGHARNLDSAAVWHRRPLVRYAAAAIALFIVVAGIAALRFRAGPSETPMVALSTRVGEIRKFALADGSSVTLDAASSLQVSMTVAARQVRMIDGSARFDVAPEASRSFAVFTSRGTVIAGAGRFDVTMTPTLVRVTAINGAISFQGRMVAPGLGSPASLMLNPGQRLSLADRRPEEIASAPSGATDWATGMLTFDRERLADAVSELNRHNAHTIVLADAALGELRITGAFHSDDPAGFARAVAALLGLSVREQAGGTIELSRRKKP